MWIHQLDTWDQNLTHWAATLGVIGEGLFRLALSAIAGGLVGLERELRGRQAGFRTNLLVCLGSALTMVVSLQFAKHQWTAQSANLGININVDPARIAYGVMTGVGFLGAGAIIRHQASVRGLTTAAAMWCIASVGLALGFGMYMISFLAVIIILAALWILDYFEDWLPKTRYRTITVRRKWEIGCIAKTVDRFKLAGLDVTDASFQRSNDMIWADISLKIAFINKHQYFTFERQLEGDSQYQLLATQEL